MCRQSVVTNDLAVANEPANARQKKWFRLRLNAYGLLLAGWVALYLLLLRLIGLIRPRPGTPVGYHCPLGCRLDSRRSIEGAFLRPVGPGPAVEDSCRGNLECFPSFLDNCFSTLARLKFLVVFIGRGRPSDRRAQRGVT